MSNLQYTKLIEDFCADCGMDPALLMDGGPIGIDGVNFSLVFNESVDPDLLFIYCVFGEIEAGKGLEVYRNLLKTNMYLYDGAGPVFTLCSLTGRVILARHCRLDQLGVKELSEILTTDTTQAKTWQAEYLTLVAQ
ncbi:CesT family type III secretion system chaperone [Herbaspirillum sp. ST 5-3]|uniref:CesT family type III secretion system chaperone n=1 Tax=Oxalobacteraceae TaxID=75682 RepID=UPI0010A490E6|nr:CesT family type III secretion system chaperone [Herbaspirillum sp. ST 5-3]